jgi:hypothetical protein
MCICLLFSILEYGYPAAEAERVSAKPAFYPPEKPVAEARSRNVTADNTPDRA